MAEKGLDVVDNKFEEVILKNPISNKVNSATKSKTAKTIGGLAFMIGFTLAVIAGLINGYWAVTGETQQLAAGVMSGVMALIGLIVGMVNISDKEAITFLIGAIAVTAATAAMTSLGSVGAGVMVVGEVTNFVAVFIGSLAAMIAAFVAPAALVVGLKVVYSSARKA